MPNTSILILHIKERMVGILDYCYYINNQIVSQLSAEIIIVCLNTNTIPYCPGISSTLMQNLYCIHIYFSCQRINKMLSLLYILDRAMALIEDL